MEIRYRVPKLYIRSSQPLLAKLYTSPARSRTVVLLCRSRSKENSATINRWKASW